MLEKEYIIHTINIFKEIRINISTQEPTGRHCVSILEQQLKMVGILSNPLAGMYKGSSYI